MQKYRVIVIIVGVVVGAVVCGALIFGLRRGDLLPQIADSNITDDDEAELPDDVVVTVEEFGDYQSLPCVELHPVLKELKREFGPNLNLVFRNLPVPALHKNSLLAAQTAEAARMQNRFWEMHDLLYQNQHQWKDEPDPKPTFIKFAGHLGLDQALFERDLDSEQVRLRLEADRDAAARLGVETTPAVFINGRRLKAEALNAEGIREGIEVMTVETAPNSP